MTPEQMRELADELSDPAGMPQPALWERSRIAADFLRQCAEAKPAFYVHRRGHDDEELVHAEAVNGHCAECEPLYLHPAPQPNWQPVPPRACIKPTIKAADAFWRHWRENGETHKHGYYESTWGAINAALACGWTEPAPQPQPAQPPDTGKCDECGKRSADGWLLYCAFCLDPPAQRHAALDRMADNARELGLDYDGAPVQADETIDPDSRTISVYPPAQPPEGYAVPRSLEWDVAALKAAAPTPPAQADVREPIRSEQLREAGFTRRDNRIACDECGKKFTPQFLPIHRCEPTEAQIEEVNTRAAFDVLAERRRQIGVEGWTPEHDDGHVLGEIAAMAAFYAMPDGAREWDASGTGYGDTFGEAIRPDGWDAKTGDRRRELVKAGALILAEIERLDRAALAAKE